MFVIIRACQSSARFKYIRQYMRQYKKRYIILIENSLRRRSLAQRQNKNDFIVQQRFYLFERLKKEIIIHTRIQPFKSNCSWTVHQLISCQVLKSVTEKRTKSLFFSIENTIKIQRKMSFFKEKNKNLFSVLFHTCAV